MCAVLRLCVHEAPVADLNTGNSIMSDNTNNNGAPHGGAGVAHPEPQSHSHSHSHPECSGCGETSHILLPLADLLKAVASTLQTHPSHSLPGPSENHQPVETTPVNEGPQANAEPSLITQAFRSAFDRRPAAPTSLTVGVRESDCGSTAPNVDAEWNRHCEQASAQAGETVGQSISAGEEISETIDQQVETQPSYASEPGVGDEIVAGTSDSEVADGQMLATPSFEEPAMHTDNGSEPEATPTPTSSAAATQEIEEEEEEEEEEAEEEAQPEESPRKHRRLPALFSKQEKQQKQSTPWGDDEENSEPAKSRFKVWQGIDGIAVMLFGVMFPALICLGAATSVPKRLTLIMLNHPIETIVELFLLAMVPLTNYALWSAVRRDDMRLSLKRGMSMGSAMITSFIASGVSFAALLQDNGQMMQTEIGTTFQAGFTWLSVLSFLAGASTAYILYKHIKARDFAQSRRLILAYTAIGALLSTCSFFGAEARSWYVRMSERMACSNHAAERADGLARLRPVYDEMQMRMECTDSRAAGLAGLFFPIKPDAEKELYFRLTGKPFSYHDQNNDLSTMPDDYVSRQVVGDMAPGLSMVRSEMSAAVHPKTLTTSIDWTFVYRNESYNADEARSQIGLPPGAVITGLTEWVNGEQVHGIFTATGKAQQDSTLDASYSPATIVDLGHNRALLRCSSIQPDAEVKVALKMIVPLQPENLRSSSLVLPKLIATNFTLEDENSVKLYSPLTITSAFNDLYGTTTGGGIQMLSGQLEGKRFQSAEIIVTVARPAAKSDASLAVLDKLAVKLADEDERIAASKRRKDHGNFVPLPAQLTVIVDGRDGIKSQLEALSSQLNHHSDALGQHPRVKTVKPQFVVQTVTRVKSQAPKQLVIVVDGSDTMKGHANELREALSVVPRDFPVKMMIASQDNKKLSHEVPLSEGLSNLDPANFSGGQNNLKSVIDAAEDAGTVKGSAVLWIHGPQPVSNSEIYITTPYGAQPSLYELPVESGEIDTSEFFKNHNDIGTFLQVSHRTTLAQDIASFFEKWTPNSEDYAVSLTSEERRFASDEELSEAEGHELLQLNAYKQCMQLMADRKPRSAARIAVAYGILTPVSCLLVQSQKQEAQSQQAQSQQEQQSQTALQPQSQPTLQDQTENSEAPALQGATNGTLGPQGADATYVTGLNTAGAVRVNNLANLEALLNIIANGAEIGALIVALIYGISGLMPDADGKRNGQRMVHRLVIAAVIAIVGLSVPGTINFFVASARDANLFN